MNSIKTENARINGCRICVGQLQGIGKREVQQDSCGTDASREGYVLAVVADGMGGLVNSEQVSQGIVNGILKSYAPGSDPGHLQLLQLLKRSVDDTKKLVSDKTYDSGSTVAMCILEPVGLSWLTVGDSRVYLWRGGGLIQLNRDHDFGRELDVMTIQDQVTPREALDNPRRGNLTSYIGESFPKYIDYNAEPLDLMRGDKILLASDGIYRGLSVAELNACLEKPTKKCVEKMEKLIEKKAFAQQDNYTAIVIGL